MALEEDVGSGDLSAALIPEGARARFVIAARENLVACGLPIADYLLRLAAKDDVAIDYAAREGQKMRAGEAMMAGEAPARALLTAERTALNFIRQLSAVATFAARLCEEMEGTGARLLDTRKTLPGMRSMQKYAARVGGAKNHRFGLYDGVMIKDNHIAVCGSIERAVDEARRRAPLLTKIEVECDSLEQVEECLTRALPDVVMLDNMSEEDMRLAVAMRRDLGSTITFEASGNVTLSRVRAVAETGVECISVGALTHSPPPVDIGLDVV